MIWLTVFAALLSFQDSVRRCFGRCRRKKLLPLALADGFDMILLHSGQWIIHRELKPNPLDIRAFYDAETHTIINPSLSEAKLKRWRWLSVTTDDKVLDDSLTEFFSELRYSASLIITNNQAIQLFACQKGGMPYGECEVVLRTGFVEPICVGYGFHKSRSNEDIINLYQSMDIVR
jgi:hypothetical protein